MVKEKTIKHHLHLSLDVDGIPEQVSADKRKLKQILYNLLSNAVKFTPDGGSIRVAAKQKTGSELPIPFADQAAEQRWIQISVADTGIGLDPAYVKKIFEPFEQADNSSERKYQGTGLGLSLCKKLVELHGGHIWAVSEGQGKGSEFSFVIPV
jgi:signal transduction histidine kinase